MLIEDLYIFLKCHCYLCAVCSLFNTYDCNVDFIIMDSTEFTTDVRIKRTSDLCLLAKQLMSKICGFSVGLEWELVTELQLTWEQAIINVWFSFYIFIYKNKMGHPLFLKIAQTAYLMNYLVLFLKGKKWKHNSDKKFQLSFFFRILFLYSTLNPQCYFYQAVVIWVI